MLFDLTGKIAVVSGTAQGLGECVLRRLVSAGAYVIGTDVKALEGEAVAASLPDKCAFYGLDISNEAAVRDFFAEVGKKHGRVDILVNCAGIITPEVYVRDLDLSEVRRVMDINYFGTFHMVKYALPLMPDFSAICLTSSIGDIAAFPGYGTYGPTKGAVTNLTKTVALEEAARGIRCNCISPGSMNTPMLYADGCETETKIAKYCWPLARFLEPEEAAAIIHALVADDCKFLTGQNIIIDGGFMAGFCAAGMEKWAE
jgi:meso-butanediol dehydrogenase/(S,S)-butanediol dehydrogenase/diacetyl reductase